MPSAKSRPGAVAVAFCINPAADLLYELHSLRLARDSWQWHRGLKKREACAEVVETRVGAA